MSKKEAWCFCPLLLNIHVMQSNVTVLYGAFGKSRPFATQAGEFCLVMADHLDLCKDPRSAVSTSRRDFCDSWV